MSYSDGKSALTRADLGLTAKQLAWCQAYLAHGGAKRAAVEAGYPLLNASKVGSELKAHPKVRLWLALQDDSGTLAARRKRAKLEHALWGNHAAAHEGRPVTDKNGSVVGTVKDLSASNRALELIGKMHNVFIEQHNVTGQVTLAALVIDAANSGKRDQGVVVDADPASLGGGDDENG